MHRAVVIAAGPGATPGVVDVTADSEDDIAEVVDVINDSGDEHVTRVRSGVPPLRFHGYRRGRELGRGASGKVFLCSRKGDAGGFAVKAVDLRRLQLHSNSERERKSLCREVEILKSLPQHRNIVQLIDAFEEGDWFLLVLELVGGGDLYTVLTAREPARLLEIEAACVLEQLADGLAHLHNQRVIHRDLKLENVLVASETHVCPEVLYVVKITDFGLSKAVGAGFSEAQSLVGTRPYVAPEVLARGSYDFSSDIWCLGVLLYVLLAGHFLPFDQLAADLKQEDLNCLIDAIDVSTSARAVVTGLLQVDPMKRQSLAAISNNEWLAASGRPPKRQCTAARGEAVNISSEMQHTNIKSSSVELGNVAAHDGTSPWAPQSQPFQASGLGEWLAHMCSTARRSVGSEAPNEASSVLLAVPHPGIGSPATAEEFDEFYAQSSQPDTIQVQITLPSYLVDAILGHAAGLHLRQVATTLGCKLRVVSREGISSHLVIMLGNCGQCSVLQELLFGRFREALRQEGQEPVDHFEVAMLVRAEGAGVVVGKQGFVINQIRKQSGAKIQLLREQIKGKRPCILSGSLQSILRAERHVFDLVSAVPVALSHGGE